MAQHQKRGQQTNYCPQEDDNNLPPRPGQRLQLLAPYALDLGLAARLLIALALLGIFVRPAQTVDQEVPLVRRDIVATARPFLRLGERLATQEKVVVAAGLQPREYGIGEQ